MRIPEQKIEEIRLTANIVDVVSTFVPLKKRGKNFIGLCPFHTEKTPSFTVSEEKQIYHCFGCHSGGNVFKFLMEYNSISFVEAVTEIAESLGIAIGSDQSSNEEQNETELLYDINTQAAKFFSDNLLNSLAGEIARSYFENRKINTQTQRIFGLGYSPPSWDAFLNFAAESKIDIQKAKLLGLVDQNDSGKFYDKFRGRIIFPIFSTNGRVIGFGGRIFDKDVNAAKYLNSPESPLYSKRKSLYGLFHSKDEIRKLDKVILVEGYMDLISLSQHGFKNVVASSGTSLTEEQVKLLSRFSKNIVVIFDADIAGQKASLRSIELLLKSDFEVKVVSLPENEDPDSFLNKFGKEKFSETLLSARNFLEYQTEQYRLDGRFEDPAEQTKAIRELVKSASLVSDHLKRSLLLKSISKKFNLREKLLESELNKILERSDIKSRQPSNYERLSQTSTAPAQEKQIDSSDTKLETELIVLLFEGNKEIIELVFEHITPEYFKNHDLKNLAELVLEKKENVDLSPAGLFENIKDENLRKMMLSLLLKDESISSKWDDISGDYKPAEKLLKSAFDLTKKIRVRLIDEEIKINNQKVKNSSEENEILELLKCNNELMERKKSVLSEELKSKE